MRKKCEYCGKYNCKCNNKKNNDKKIKENHCHEECSSCHEHEHSSELNNKEKIIYAISIFIFIITMFWVPENWKWVGYLCTIVLSGIDIILEGIKNIFKLNFEEDTLMTIAVIAAFILGEYPESCLVLLLYKLGEFLEDKIVEKSQKNVEAIANIKEETANLVKRDGNIEKVLSKEVEIGQKIMIKPGEKVPLDCKILEGKSNIDASAITGESNTISVKEGEELLSGSINLTSTLIAEVQKDYENSMASQIVDLVYEATNNKGKTEKFITKFSKKYTPAVILIAVLIAIILPLFNIIDFRDAIEKSLIFLVASCPCSIVISIPVAMFAGVGAIAKKGLLVKGTKHMEDLSNVKIIAFDKTGTLTTGKMELDNIEVVGNYSKETILDYIVNIEKRSNHPIAQVFFKLTEHIKDMDITEFEEIPGHGIYAKVDEKEILIGNRKLLEKYKVEIPRKSDVNYVVINKEVVAYITLKEEIKEENREIVSNLKKVGIKRIVILTGDNLSAAKKVGDELKISEIYAGLLPKEKQEKVQSLKKNKEKVIFVGDGINDGPVLASADFGISMGKGTEIANYISDSILLSNQVSNIPDCIKFAKKTMSIVRFNIIFSLLVKAIVIILGFLGIAPIWMAVLADTGVTFLTVANSLRIYKS